MTSALTSSGRAGEPQDDRDTPALADGPDQDPGGRPTDGPRYAVYFAPQAGTAWWRFGAGWLGRDEVRDAPLPQPVVPGFESTAFDALTADPRLYGFHATLKAPFRLREGCSEGVLRERLGVLASRLDPLSLGPLRPRTLDGFVALVPQAPPAGLAALEALCVVDLDDLRAPLSPHERARRRPEQLDVRCRELLERFGYPLVLDRFRFHMTLTAVVDAATAERLANHAQAVVAPLNEREALQLDRLCLFRQQAPGGTFVRVHDEVLRP